MSSTVEDSLYKEVGNYLLTSDTWLDCYFLVGKSKERIGAVRSALVNQSRTWWSMLSPDSPLAEKADITLPDIEPDVFRLFLKYVYGGVEDFSSFPEDTVVKLCYCANKYLMTHLMRKISARLQPSSVDEVFSALHCLVYYNLSDVEKAVKEIVQTKTMQIFSHPEFLGCEVESVSYIAKQDKLNCEELELWSAVVTWARHRVIDCPTPNSLISEQDSSYTNQMSEDDDNSVVSTETVESSDANLDTMPDVNPNVKLLFPEECHGDTNDESENSTEAISEAQTHEGLELRKWVLGPLQHIRLLTLDVTDIYKEVFVWGILKSHEMVGICKRDIQDIETLCKKTEKRGTTNSNIVVQIQQNIKASSDHFSASCRSCSCIIVDETSIRLESITCKGYICESCHTYKNYFFGLPLTVDIMITITRITNHIDNTSDEEPVVVRHKAFKHFYAELFTIPTVVGRKGVVLLANSTYMIDLLFSNSPLEVAYNKLPSWSTPDCVKGHDFEHGKFHCSLTYNNGIGQTPCHIRQFTYSVALDY